MGSVSSFWSHICACKFMLAYIYHVLFRVGGRVGDYLKYSPILLLCWENVWKDLKKKQCSLKMYITMKYQFILNDKKIERVTRNEPSIPCFKPLTVKLSEEYPSRLQ